MGVRWLGRAVLLASLLCLLPASAQAAYPEARTGLIAFSQEVGGQSDVFVMNADGSNQVNLTPSSPNDDLDPQFSPDGKRIVFARSFASGPGHIMVMNRDGTEVVDLTPAAAETNAQPVWTPDGKRIVFVSDIALGPMLFVGTITIMNADGSGVEDLTPGGGSFEFAPDVSPDGERVAFDRLTPDGDSEIFELRLGGVGLTRFTGYSESDTDPAYSPDGELLAWSRDASPGAGTDLNVFVAGLDRREARFITSGNPANDQAPAFSPDGRLIALDATAPGVGIHLFSVGLDGSGRTDLTPSATGGGATSPAWEYRYRCAGKAATIVGDDGPERIKGTKRRDVIVANGGRDRISGRGGNDRICGGRGRDTLTGGKGEDHLIGGKGRDEEKD